MQKRNLIAALIVAGLGLGAYALLRPTDDHDHDHGHGHGHGTESAVEHNESTRISESAAREAGVISETAGPATLQMHVPVTGRIIPDPDKFAHVSARFAGVIKNMNRNVGDRVAKGDVLGTVESNDSLRTYQLVSPIAGTVNRRDGVIGGATGSGPLFEIADTSTVAVDFTVFPAQAAAIKAGQRVTVKDANQKTVASTIAGISTAADTVTQAVHARATFPNDEGGLVPGTLVTGEIVTTERAVPVAVKVSGLQTMDSERVVFVKTGDVYEARPLELGQNDGTYAEVLNGIAAGTTYVSDNSFLLKADIEKAGAAHEH